MDEYKHVETCFVCGRSFQFGHHRYDGSMVWGEMFCRTCIASNHDGIVLERHPKLAEHLREVGADMTRNAKGWLPWPLGMI